MKYKAEKHIFMNFRKLVLSVIAIVISLGANSQAVKKNPPVKSVQKKPLVQPKNPKTLLWEVTGNGLPEPSYVFGTMHILCAEDAKLSANLKAFIQKSKKIYFEIDMDDMVEMMSAMKYVRMNDGVKISDLLTAEEYGRIEAYFKKNKSPMPLSMINRFKPFFVSSLLGEQSMDCPQKNGMEQLIMKEANKYDKTIMGLESVAFQATLFDSIPYEKQAKELLNYIDSMDNYKKSTMEMVAVYKSQDLDRLDSLVSKSDPAMKDYMDLMLYSRNRKWVQQMPQLMMEGTLLFAVGAGHLPGEEGVLNLLKKSGYTLKPIANN